MHCFEPDRSAGVPSNSAWPALAAALDGDVASIALLGSFPPQELCAASRDHELVLTRSAVLRVLEDFARGLPDHAVHSWASFVRRGYVTHALGPIRPLSIEYEPAYEEAIVAAVGRMDELGDLIDGTIDAAEIERLIAALAEPTERTGHAEP